MYVSRFFYETLFTTIREICQGTLPIEQLSIRHNMTIAKDNKDKKEDVIASSKVHKECVERENKNRSPIETNMKEDSKNANTIHDRAIGSELTNKTHNDQIESNSWEKNVKCDDSENCEHTKVGIDIDTHRKDGSMSVKHLHTCKAIQNDDTLNKNKRRRRVEDHGLNNAKCGLKTNVEYEKDTNKNIQDVQTRK